jgi:hypothetical protein
LLLRDVLIVLNPRRIPYCLKPLNDLWVDKLWLRNMTEPQIAAAWPDILDRISGYDWAWIQSDDGIARPHALDSLYGLALEGHPVVTGYSNLDQNDTRVNLCKTPLGVPCTREAFNLMTLHDVLSHESEVVPTWFAGFSLTGMSLDNWAKYPYQLEEGGMSADYNLSKRLELDGVPIVAHRDALVWHVKEQWSQADTDHVKRLYVGVEPPSIDLEVFPH